MNTIVQWATILSPILAVILAWWMTRNSAKDNAKQIESIKELAKIQVETNLIQIENELWEAQNRYAIAAKKKNDMNNPHKLHFYDEMIVQIDREQEKIRDLADESDFQMKHTALLIKYRSRLNELLKRLGGI